MMGFLKYAFMALLTASVQAVLRRMPCPRPANGRPADDTVGACTDAGLCGCECGIDGLGVPLDSEAAALLRSQGVGVRELEWSETKKRGWDVVVARPEVGFYLIAEEDVVDRHGFSAYYNEEWLGETFHSSLEAAKAAAQSDYETRIRSALTAPVSPVAVNAELVEALRPFARAYDTFKRVWGPGDDQPVYDYELVVGDFHRANAALAKASSASPEPVADYDPKDELRWTMKAVLYHFGPDGAGKVANTVIQHRGKPYSEEAAAILATPAIAPMPVGDELEPGELRPCPFCGGEAERLELDDEANFGGSVISCKKCGASSPVHFDRKENLDSSWNDRRALASAPPAGSESDLLHELSLRQNWELDWGPLDNSDENGEQVWRVHSRNGGRNDREWTLLGTGDTPQAALRAALQPGQGGEA